ncbi:MAG: HEAT repeat domain-containing protein, partial [Limisphaerales bacterium]
MPCVRASRIMWVLVGALSALLLTWGLFHQSIDRALSTRLLLHSAAPREEFFRETVRESGDPANLLRQCWATGRIVQRVLVAQFLSESVASNLSLVNALQDLVFAGAADVDVSVRELALATLDALKSPRLLECCRAQLDDADPMVRLLGLQYLRKSNAREAVPLAVRLLDDGDPRVAAEAEVALMRWSGQDFGVRMRMAIPAQTGPDAGRLSSANAEAIHRGIKLRKEWWNAHAREYAKEGAGAPVSKPPGPELFLASDFKLKDLRGRTVS